MPDRKLTLADLLAGLSPEDKAKVDAQVRDMKALAREAGIAGTCNKCRYWKPHGLGIGSGFAHSVPKGWQECTLTQQSLPNYANVMTLVPSDDDADAIVLTAPDYGCLQSRLPDPPKE